MYQIFTLQKMVHYYLSAVTLKHNKLYNLTSYTLYVPIGLFSINIGNDIHCVIHLHI